MKKALLLIAAMVLANVLNANNILLTNLQFTGQNTTDDYMMVQFDISWENSWRTSAAPNNWDAAWVFVKYRIPVASGGDGIWKHAWLNDIGHTAPAGSTIEIGLLTPGAAFDATTNPGLGAFIYRDADGTGTFSKTGVQLRWNYGANGVADDAVLEFMVYAIEMVYVPQGAFYAGSGWTEYGCFTDGSWTDGYAIPFTISSEDELTVAQSAGNLWYVAYMESDDQEGPIPAAFPKGYNSFYCMKYEISQQGYVDFLNSLTAAQTVNRYPGKSTYRHGITVSSGVYSTTLPYLACNWLSWDDVAAYLDWSGLRPITELEFEKACRGNAVPVAGEFAWGTTAVASSEYTLSNGGSTNEAIATNYSTSAGNASYSLTNPLDIYGGIINGPLRVGIFAGTAGNTGRVTAGASYYGIMEMSGNVLERCVCVGNTIGRAFAGTHGNGEIEALTGYMDVPDWPGTGNSAAGLRGGAWGYEATYMAVSDRRFAAIVDNSRFWDRGGRGVRSTTTSLPAVLPTVSTTSISDITTITATGGGNVTSNGGSSVNARGICWSTSSNPTTADSHTSDGTGTGSFVSNLTSLAPGTHYWVRAYAINSMGTAYGNEVGFTTEAWICGTSMAISHEAGDIAPVAKTVTYNTVTSIPGESSKCWITSNLGSDHQASASDDDTEASAGWYWQFNKKQGYKYETSTRTPGTSWTSYFNEDSQWLPANDPCAHELGTGWRIPAYTEWYNVAAAGTWVDRTGPWNSPLKLHAAGYLIYTYGWLGDFRGSTGRYWSSTQYDNTTGWYLYFDDAGCNFISEIKANAFSIRCLKDAPANEVPTVTTAGITDIMTTTATGGGEVTFDGGPSVTARGLCWSTSHNPTIAGSNNNNGGGTGSFVSSLSGLMPGTLYYVRAYATNSVGTGYGNEVSFTTNAWICGTSNSISHVVGDVAPLTKTVTYGTVSGILGEPGKCWITSNLGADHQASAVTDATEASAGWYWQFNRKQGYKHDGSSPTPAWTITSINENSDWQSDSDPCALLLGTGWRIPVKTEWENVDAAGGWTNWDGPWNSNLKLHLAGYLRPDDGSLHYRGTSGIGYYWSSNQFNSANGWYLSFYNVASQMFNDGTKAYGFSLRCIRN
jgi:hypothetical protein